MSESNGTIRINKYKDNKIFTTYIDHSKIHYSGQTIPNMSTDFYNGPTIIINTHYERPLAITKNDIDSGSNIPVVCDTIYPAYLASIEDTNTYGADNAIRCSYAKLCGYSWSDMGCN